MNLGSEIYLAIDRNAHNNYYRASELANVTYSHGSFQFMNGSVPFDLIPGVLGQGNLGFEQLHQNHGCFRDPSWPFLRQSIPTYAQWFLLVPLYALISSMSAGQRLRSKKMIVMVVLACASWAVNKAVSSKTHDRADLSSFFGALTVGVCGNIWGMIIGRSAYPVMLVGVLFLVPVGSHVLLNFTFADVSAISRELRRLVVLRTPT